VKKKSINISIEKNCGENRISREDGLRLREWIEKEWEKNDKLTFDFGNILIASVSFIDEAFAKLAFDHSKDELVNKLKFENLRPFDRALLNDLVVARIREMESNCKKRDTRISPKKAKAKNKKLVKN